jgi:hypothetical protein
MILNRQDFENWLRGESGVVGKSCTPGNCPLAMFLREKRGAVGVRVTHDCFFADVVAGDLPSWAQDFVTELDAMYREEAVTANQALDVLNSI